MIGPLTFIGQIYRELAEQKRDKAERERAQRPRERDYEAEHADDVKETRASEEAIEDR